jgi:ribosomal protein S18 acetylase RimI-like enzyme
MNIQVSRILTPPEDWFEMVSDITSLVEERDGEEEAARYWHLSHSGLLAVLQMPSIEVWTARGNARTLAVVYCETCSVDSDKPAMRIDFFHAAAGAEGRMATRALIREVVAEARERRGVKAISFSHATLRASGVLAEFSRLGFTPNPREFLLAPLPLSCGLAHSGVPGFSLCPLRLEDCEEAADCLVECYAGHRALESNWEARNREDAMDFFESVEKGHYGITHPDWFFGLEHQGTGCLAGFVLGMKTRRDQGYVLHVAVRPDYRNGGIGSALLRTLGHRFVERGLKSARLCVRAENPARHLYHRMGFCLQQPHTAYVWWSPE